MNYQVSAHRVDDHGSVVTTKQALIVIDTDLKGRNDAFNPAEMLLASLAACILKGTERMIPILKFELRGIEVKIMGERQDIPPKMTKMEYKIVVDTDETDKRLDLLHLNLQKYGTIYNTLADSVQLSGTISRKV